MPVEAALLAVHAGCSFAMFGVIWLIQLVHYPAFAFVERERFPEFHRLHCRNTGVVVVPLMCGELITGLSLALLAPTVFLLPGLLILIAWLSTFLLQVPCHAGLEAGFNQEAHQTLVRTNWIRTIAWSARAAFLLVTLLHP